VRHCGFTNPGPDARDILAWMNAAWGHRGPDSSGTFVDRGIALGHTRLAIIDITGGAQPRFDETSGDALIYNGEIYGYRALAAELRSLGTPLRDHSDTEVLFHLYVAKECDARSSGSMECSPLPIATGPPVPFISHATGSAKSRSITVSLAKTSSSRQRSRHPVLSRVLRKWSSTGMLPTGFCYTNTCPDLCRDGMA